LRPTLNRLVILHGRLAIVDYRCAMFARVGLADGTFFLIPNLF